MDFLVIDDDKTFRDATCLMIEGSDHYAEGVPTGQTGLERVKEEKFDGVLLDLNLGSENGLDILKQITSIKPDLPVVMLTADGSIQTAVESMRRGAVDFLEKPFQREQFITVLARLQRLHQMGRKIETLQNEVRESQSQNPEILFDFSESPMKQTVDVLMRAARTPASILITGESGTGKTIMARAVHNQSHLADQPFVTVSCPSLSKELLESELFGHVRGAFTGAVKDHWGKVKAATGGTLFLDEIGDLPLEIQPKLLRLLQEREYERLGESITRKADVRVIAATNRELKKRVDEGGFREDLYFRLNVIAVEMPPLRARSQDLLRFAEHYLQHFGAQSGRKLRGFSDDARSCLMKYAWPGNLRELRNAIERAAILAHQDIISPEDLPLEARGENPSDGDPASTPHAGGALTLEQLEEAHIRLVVARANSLTQAADILGIDQATLYRKRKKIGLE